MKTQREELQGKIEEIQTAWLIGLGYTVPPYNGQHSQEMFKQFLALFLSEWEKLIPEKIYIKTGASLIEAANYDGFNTCIDQFATTLKQLEAEKKV